jgi:DNA modification methylase
MTERYVNLNKTRYTKYLQNCIASSDITVLKRRVKYLKNTVSGDCEDKIGILNITSNGDTISMKTDVLISDLIQILDARTKHRAKYYLKRLKNGVERVKTNKVNDINLWRWKEYSTIITDSLWMFKKRDASGVHHAWYWGNFVPQIPRQLMLRYTKKGDWVLDTFVGSGTTLIECRRLGRHGIGIELYRSIAEKALKLVEREDNKYGVNTDIIIGDSTRIDFKKILSEKGIQNVQLLIMHPPYHDIIKFGTSTQDLSNAQSIKKYLQKFRKVVENTYSILEEDRYLAVVVGDKYSKGEWIPLGFYVMQEVMRCNYKLKSVIVKNFEDTLAKRQQKDLWRYRALVGGFYVFKHEYIFVFKK